MKRRNFLALGGALAGTGVLATAAIADDDSEATADAVGAEQNSLSRETTDESLDGTSVQETKLEKVEAASDQQETALEQLEEAALESPEELTESEVEQLLSAHEDHATCPICQGLQSGGFGSGMSSP